MPAGLINIVSYGAQDLYLTGTPEITFFKIVYRRYTNFSMESIEVNFEDTFGFGKESNLVIPPIADLIHKLYLKIRLPYVKLTGRKIDNTKEFKTMKDNRINLLIVQKFTNLNMIAYRKALEQYEVVNISTATDMIKVILVIYNQVLLVKLDDTYINEPEITLIINNYHNLITTKLKYDFKDINLGIIATNAKGTIYEQDKNLFLNLINRAIELTNEIYNLFNDKYVESIKQYNDVSNKTYKFAWVKRLGHSIIEYIDIFIGGEKIDRQYGEWMDIWYELAGNKNMSKTYDKLIGNRYDLTTFDRNDKYYYTLFIPLQFWFCKFNGLALPLIAMQYSDVSIKLKLRKIQECCYIDEELKNISIQDILDNDSIEDIDINNQTSFSNGLKSSLYIDYIFLDSAERRKFAQVAHEYLIEQVEMQSETHTEEIITTSLGFNYCSKEIIWVAQKQSHIVNLDQHTECMWWNYGVNLDGSVNPIIKSKMEFNGYTIFPEENGNYFNYVQPYIKHRNTPTDGINVYSFSLKPEEQQPTGSCNFTRISQNRLILKLDPNVFNIIDRKTGKIINNNDIIYVKIFSLRLNVLRIIGGYGALAFV